MKVKLEKTIRVARGSVSLDRPVVAHDSIYAGHAEQDLVKLDWIRFEPEWRIRSDGFQSWCSVGEMLLQVSTDSPVVRAIRTDGTVAWTLPPKGRWGWELWRDRLYSLDLEGGIDLFDPATGQHSGNIPLDTKANEVLWARCGDTLLICDQNGDPFRAFNLLTRQFLWERLLLSEIRSTYGVWEEGNRFAVRPATNDRFVAQRGKGVFGVSLNAGGLLWGAVVAPESVDVREGHVYLWSGTADIHAHRFMCLECVRHPADCTLCELP